MFVTQISEYNFILFKMGTIWDDFDCLFFLTDHMTHLMKSSIRVELIPNTVLGKSNFLHIHEYKYLFWGKQKTYIDYTISKIVWV